MNLKISENNFRFRIAPDDLDRLLRGQDVDQRVCLGAHCFTYRISPASAGTKMELEMAIAGFCLTVPREILEELRDMGRSKNGVSVKQGDVDISLQVDIKTQMKRAA